MTTAQIHEAVAEDEILRTGTRLVNPMAAIPVQTFLPGPQVGRLSSKEGQQLADQDYEGWGWM